MHGYVEHMGILRSLSDIALVVDVPFGGRTHTVTILKSREIRREWATWDASTDIGRPITVRLAADEASRLGLSGF